MGSPTKRSYAAGFFQMSLDGAKTTAYLKSVEGGFYNHNIIDERIGPSNQALKHAATVECEPISFEFGLSGANSVLQWIKASWDKNFGRRSGQIDHADFNCEKQFEIEFSDALILETTFPKLDGASKEAGYIKVKCQPDAVVAKRSSGGKLDAHTSPKQKMWNCSSFRLSIDGIEEMKYVNSIESFTIKQNVQKMLVGKRRHPELIPTKIEFPNLSCTMSLQYADGVLDWYDSYVRKGSKDPDEQKTGTLEFLAPDKKTILFRINMKHIGLQKVTIPNATANADQIKRLKFDMYVGDMTIDGRVGFES